MARSGYEGGMEKKLRHHLKIFGYGLVPAAIVVLGVVMVVELLWLLYLCVLFRLYFLRHMIKGMLSVIKK